MIHYQKPSGWIMYDKLAVADMLTEAKAATLALRNVPYQKRWADALQQIELKREVAGTSRIEGAEFTDKELESALKDQTPEDLFTRSQRQAAAAKRAYEWIAQIPADQPVDAKVILHIHALMVRDADDDHCEPGVLRASGNNVTFGTPAHRGCTGGEECQTTFAEFAEALNTEFRAHDPLIRAIAAHYHIAAMHPFLDGNGRTARGLEALLLGKAGLRDTTFIAMSNYYYDEKASYLRALATVRAAQHDLTAFLNFALKGIAFNARRLLRAIQREIKRELVINLLRDFYDRLQSPKKRVIGQRQAHLMSILLAAEDSMHIDDFVKKALPAYAKMKSPYKAIARDGAGLLDLGAIEYDGEKETVWANLEWPTQVTESDFFKTIKAMPVASTRWMKR